MENQHRMITGYTEFTQEQIDLMNEVKAHGAQLEALLDKVNGAAGDARWTAIAKTQLQEGLMALTRAVAKPDFF